MRIHRKDLSSESSNKRSKSDMVKIDNRPEGKNVKFRSFKPIGSQDISSLNYEEIME
jgi:hypothetical protein